MNQVQALLRRPIPVGNPSACLRWADISIAEPAFFDAPARYSGCGLLLALLLEAAGQAERCLDDVDRLDGDRLDGAPVNGRRAGWAGRV